MGIETARPASHALGNAMNSTGKCIPRATYRLQFNRDFTIRDAVALMPYLRELGISHCYASPLFRAPAESTHGYDVSDYQMLNPVLGTEREFCEWTDQLRQAGMGLLLDIVPNHMGVADPANRWWMDVLAKGRHAPSASYFDIDWDAPGLEGRVLLPILEDHFGTVLEAGKIQLRHEDGDLWIRYYERRLPLSAAGWRLVLGRVRQAWGEADEPDMAEAIDQFLHTLAQPDPARSDSARDEAARRIREWFGNATSWGKTFTAVVADFAGQPGAPATFDALEQLLAVQHYRLAYWRVGASEINYRRFFAISDLAAVRMESLEVFADAHQAVFQWVADGRVNGLRVDHPDGLWDPGNYFARLQETCGPIYVVAEKILTGEEALPETWLVDGTTGYDFLSRVNGLFVDPSGEGALDRVWQAFGGEAAGGFEETAYRGKRKILERSLVSDLDRLTRRLRKVAGLSRHGKDLRFDELRAALMELLIVWPVYRTYLSERQPEGSKRDRCVLRQAFDLARQRTGARTNRVWDFLEWVFLGLFAATGESARAAPKGRVMAGKTTGLETAGQARLNFVRAFQQLSGAVTAKGIEDTAFYNFNRLTSLNEVGGQPDQFGYSPEGFHHWNRERSQSGRHPLLATATHDTKRGEDVRARINVLSELGVEWGHSVEGWSAMNEPEKAEIDGEPVPDRGTESLLYQTLLGCWPLDDEARVPGEFRRRVQQYMQKAVREAGEHSSWENPNEPFENALLGFVSGLLERREGKKFRRALEPWRKKVAFYGAINSLAQTVLKLVSPGVPDFFQGSELWDLSLVDPDNRRPVDFELRRRLLGGLAELDAATGKARRACLHTLLEHWKDGRVKLFVVRTLLGLRGQRPALFEKGAYMPVHVEGRLGRHVVALGRHHEDEALVAVVPRLTVGLTGGHGHWPLGDVWEDAALVWPRGIPRGDWQDCLTGEVLKVGMEAIRVGTVLRVFPVAVLTRRKDGA